MYLLETGQNKVSIENYSIVTSQIYIQNWSILDQSSTTYTFTYSGATDRSTTFLKKEQDKSCFLRKNQLALGTILSLLVIFETKKIVVDSL